MLYVALFLFFLYFKIARVHKKEEQLNPVVVLEHIVVFVTAVVLFNYAFHTIALLQLAVVSLVFFILAALMVTAVQLGIFINGKPMVKVSQIYKLFPFIAGGFVLFSFLAVA